ncbi:MAG: polyprenyl synthetase family protein [Bacteroidales bacterium]|nr:polyprenyl synthetase family protein [Bacteroidales bacterium]
MYTFKECQEIIEQEINSLKLPGEPELLYEPIRYMLKSSGKRIRPSLALMACNLFTGSVEEAIYPAIAIEVFHNFTLLHDDIMDNSDVRRGKATVHKKWNRNVAILSGDTMLIKAYELISRCKTGKLQAIMELFNKTAIEVCEGQQYDMDFEEKDTVTEDEYLKMICLKTAVLLAASLKTGAICGGSGSKDAGCLYEFGINLGMAFQLQDDLLDVYADEKVFGKMIGNDIIANKKTLLLISALQIAKGDILRELRQWLSCSEFKKEEKIHAVTNIYNILKVKELTEEKIEQYFTKAKEKLDQVSVDKHQKFILSGVADMLMGRDK